MTKLDILWKLILLNFQSNSSYHKISFTIIFSFSISLLPSLVKAQEEYKLIDLDNQNKQFHLFSPQIQNQQARDIVRQEEQISRRPKSIKIDLNLK